MKRFDWLDCVYFGLVTPVAVVARFIGLDFFYLKKSRKTLWRKHSTARFDFHRENARRGTVGDAKNAPRYILGLSAYYHDSAAALLKNGVIVAAAQEERFTRKKHDPGFPAEAVKYCLKEAGIGIEQVALAVFYEDPKLKFGRLVKTFFAFAPRGRALFRAALPVWLGGKIHQRQMLVDGLTLATGKPFSADRLVFSEHHLSHAASAYFASPFHDAAVLTIDGVGEHATTTVAIGEGDRLRMIKEIHFPHSLGLLYSAFTVYTGFAVNSGEYKLMGLAPYGKPKYAPIIFENLLRLKSDGSFQLNMDYFEYGREVRTIGKKFEDLMGGPARKPEELLTQRHMDLAASIQVVLQEAVLAMARQVAQATGKRNLCLAGGVALNCVANGHLLRSGIFENIWVQPAAGDAGGALGAAYVADILYLGNSRAKTSGADAMAGSYLGPQLEADEIRANLTEAGADFEELSENELFDTVSGALADGKAIGWVSGRMEFGPRALGGRSIIADARSSTMQKMLNLKIKNRESFRPFAPAVLREDVSTWFELDRESPYMLIVAQVHDRHCRNLTAEESKLFGIEVLNIARSTIPAVTHVDRSARVQTVDAETSPRFYRLISEFKQKTGTGVVVNTSFNIRGEPIVCTAKDAFRCFMGTQLDLLVVENFVMKKELQNQALQKTYFHEVPLD